MAHAFTIPDLISMAVGFVLLVYAVYRYTITRPFDEHDRALERAAALCAELDRDED